MTINLIDHIPFAQQLGLELTSAEPERIEATLTVTEPLCTTGKIMHGGAIMSVADTLGAIGAYLNLPDGAKATTTIESKTNFVSPAPKGTVVTGEATPVHRGRRTMIWQTRVTTAEGKLVNADTATSWRNTASRSEDEIYRELEALAGKQIS